MSEPGKAVFLSYASQDAEAARRIAEALRAAGVEVWFDQSELRGGDAWDAKIRRQIKECALFMPIISDATQARAEGYFRLEWKLAVDRSHLMADDAHFLFPVVISDTPESTARVPDRFRDVQWTRLRLDETPGELAARVAKVLGGGAEAARASDSASPTPARTPAARGGKPTWIRYAWVGVGLVLALAYGLRPFWHSLNRPGETASAGAGASEAHKLVMQARALMDDDPMVTRENFLTAKRLGERALELDPGDAEAYAVAARAGAQLIRDYQDSLPASLATARSRAESAIRLAPNSLEAALALASVNLLSGNRPAEVEKSLAALLDSWPDERRVLRLLQLAALGQDHLDEAQRWIDRTLALPGGDPESLNRRAEILWTRNDYPQMAATLEQSLAQRPTSLACHLKLMLLVWGWGDLAAGREWVEKMPASLLQEDRIANLAFLARYWSRQPEQALEILRRYPRPFIEQGSLFISTNYLAGCAQLLAGRPEAAKVEFSAGLKAVNDRLAQEPSNLRYLHEKTRLLTRLGQRAEAEQTRRVLQELAGANAAFANRPELTLLLGSTDEAIAVCERGVDRSRSRWPIRVNEMRFDPIFDPLRRDPRFQAIVARGEAQLAELRKAGGAVADQMSVAVLPFANLSEDKGNEFFSDGISEELLMVLQKIPGLRVAARTSAFSFKGRNVTATEIGRVLGVANLVEGSVQKAGGRVKVIARLSRAATGEELWSQSYTRELKDVFALQEELALAILGEVRGQLAGDTGSVHAAVKGGTSNAEAYQHYLQGRYLLNQRTERDALAARAEFRQSVALDPEFALGWVGLARSQVWICQYGSTLDRAAFDENLRGAREAVVRAQAVAPDLPAALVVKAEIAYSFDFDWPGAEAISAAARALAPADPEVLLASGQSSLSMGDRDRALEYFRQAVVLDPISAAPRTWTAFTLALTGRLEDARAEYERVATLAPRAPWSYAGLGFAYAQHGRYEEMVACAQKDAADWARLLMLAVGYHGLHRTAESDAALKELRDMYGNIAAYQVASVYAYRGELTAAFEWLERAYQQRDGGLAFARLDPFLVELRADPRWPEFLQRHHLVGTSGR